MPVYIDEMTSDVSVYTGDLPLSPEQIDRLVQLVLARLEQAEQDRRASRMATTIRNQTAPPMWFDET